jgi:hypothetical protein
MQAAPQTKMRAAALCLGVALAQLSAISPEATDLPGQLPSPPLTKTPIADPWTGFYLGGLFAFEDAIDVAGRDLAQRLHRYITWIICRVIGTCHRDNRKSMGTH